MWIYEDIEAIALCQPQDVNCMLHPLFVVLPRSSVFDSFPCEDVANEIVPPSFQPREMRMGLIYREGSADERQLVALVESIWVVRRQVWICRELGVACHINSSQGHLPVP